jgi:hypothetical protein
MQVALYSIKNIMIEEKGTEIEGNRFPIKRERSKSPIRNSTSKMIIIECNHRECSNVYPGMQKYIWKCSDKSREMQE